MVCYMSSLKQVLERIWLRVVDADAWWQYWWLVCFARSLLSQTFTQNPLRPNICEARIPSILFNMVLCCMRPETITHMMREGQYAPIQFLLLP